MAPPSRIQEKMNLVEANHRPTHPERAYIGIHFQLVFVFTQRQVTSTVAMSGEIPLVRVVRSVILAPTISFNGTVLSGSVISVADAMLPSGFSVNSSLSDVCISGLLSVYPQSLGVHRPLTSSA